MRIPLGILAGAGLWLLPTIDLRAQAGTADSAEAASPLRPGDRVVLIGNTFAERLQHFGHFETQLQRAFPTFQLTVRNLGWSGDEVDLMPRPLEFGELETHLLATKASLIVLCFGMNESFEGEAGEDHFRHGLATLIDSLKSHSFDGRERARLLLVSPIAHEALGEPWPDPEPHNRQLHRYTEIMRDLAERRGLAFCDLQRVTAEAYAETTTSVAEQGAATHFTINGIHLNDLGYRLCARAMVEALGGTPPDDGIDQERAEALRALVIDKNTLFFQRWRPVNAEYIFGRRKEPFGVLSFPPEMKLLEKQVDGLDRDIWKAAHAVPPVAP